MNLTPPHPHLNQLSVTSSAFPEEWLQLLRSWGQSGGIRHKIWVKKKPIDTGRRMKVKVKNGVLEVGCESKEESGKLQKNMIGERLEMLVFLIALKEQFGN